MTPLENFHRMMRHDDPQWLPLFMNFTPPVHDLLRRKLGEKDPADVFGIDFRATGIPGGSDDARWREAMVDLGFELPYGAEVGYCGITKISPSAHDLGEAYHLTEMLHPLSVVTTPEQIDALPWPIMGRADEERLKAHAGMAHAEGRVAVGSLECTVFEPAWYLRGMEQLLLDLVDGNGIGDRLLDRLTQRSIEAASIAARSDLDVIGLGDDVGTQRGLMMSIDFWREHLRPRLRKVIDAIRENSPHKIYIRYHSDGDIRPIIADLIDIGVDILNPVQPECMPPGEVIPTYRDRVAFWGMIGTQTTMPFGSKAAIEAAVGECARFARDGAGIIVAPTHVLEPDVPYANIAMLANAVRGLSL